MTDTAIESSVKTALDKEQDTVIIGAKSKLTLDDIKFFAKYKLPVNLSTEAYEPMLKSHEYLKSCVEQRIPIYGLNTNFGDQVSFVDANLKDSHAMPSYEGISNRQENLIKSLACSIGSIVHNDVIQVTMLLRAHCLAQGYSGVQPQLIENYLSFLNAGIVPIVKCYGSIGASGDLIPLASITAALIGDEVDVFYKGKKIRANQAIEEANLTKIKPELRDGLAMINGTSFMTAISSLSLCKLNRLFYQLLSAIGMSLESMMVISSAYHPTVHQIKNHSGENFVDQFLLDFWQGSRLLSDLDELRAQHTQDFSEEKQTKSVQDYYSLRSVAQGFGPFIENLKKATQWIEEEMNSVNDNPIIDVENKEIHHGANFMGYYVTDACDTLKIDIGQASTWIHALIANMVHPRKSHGLPANLVINPGKNNGFRSLQLLSAALAVQNRKLAQAQQSYTLPTEGDNQDVNSLGTHAALDFQEAVANLERLTAILFLTSTQALELRGIQKAGYKSQHIYQVIRQFSPTLIDCRPMTEELETMIRLLEEERI